MTGTLTRLALVTTVLLALAPSAASAEDAIGLSPDGRNWSNELAEPLFDPAVRWVPGDVREATFYVRNQAREGASMHVDLRGGTTDGLLEAGDVRIEARVADHAWSSLSRDGTHRLTTAAVPQGASERVQVRVSYGFASQNVSQVQQLQLDLAVRLTQDVAAATSTASNDATGRGAADDAGADSRGGATDEGSATEGTTDEGVRAGGSEGGEGDVLLANAAPIDLRVLLLLAAALLIILVRQRRTDDELEEMHR